MVFLCFDCSCAGGLFLCPRDSVSSDVWLQDSSGDEGTSREGGEGVFQGQCVGASSIQEDSRRVQDVEEGWGLAVVFSTANLDLGQEYVLRFRGSRWPRGAISGLRLAQPPPFTFTTVAHECSGHGTLEDDGTCVCQEVGGTERLAPSRSHLKHVLPSRAMLQRRWLEPGSCKSKSSPGRGRRGLRGEGLVSG